VFYLLKNRALSRRQFYHWHINTPMYLHRVSTKSHAVTGKTARCRYLYISTCIEFYNGIAQFLCHSMAFLYSPTSATIQMLKLHTVRWR